MYVYIYIQTNVHIYNIENPDLVETKDNLSGKKGKHLKINLQNGRQISYIFSPCPTERHAPGLAMGACCEAQDNCDAQVFN